MQHLSFAGCLVAFLVAAAQAAAQPAPAMELPSCVAGSPSMLLAATSAIATLDNADRGGFHSAAQAHYPLYRRGGFSPAEVLLLQRDGLWLYVTTAQLGTGTCFTAVFAAKRFDFTQRWLAKYRPASSPALDQ